MSWRQFNDMKLWVWGCQGTFDHDKGQIHLQVRGNFSTGFFFIFSSLFPCSPGFMCNLGKSAGNVEKMARFPGGEKRVKFTSLAVMVSFFVLRMASSWSMRAETCRQIAPWWWQQWNKMQMPYITLLRCCKAGGSPALSSWMSKSELFVVGRSNLLNPA